MICIYDLTNLGTNSHSMYFQRRIYAELIETVAQIWGGATSND